MSVQQSLFSRVPRTLATARRRRDAALAPVEDRHAAWLALACAYVLDWAWRTHRDRSPWLLEDARAAYEDAGMPPPRTPRNWGAVTKRLQREGHIASAGFAPAKSSNGSPKVAWRVK